ncbi:protein AMEIOTIC 1 homolog isoform X2 [Malania oleifera]|nr:protein AMEIOTIC 1 homolog isoform X2 [Malania oleifera]XP_057970204.1 protein AMEIOTIC 1 homolog isoform X2 [Malania oleifera]
MVQWGSSWRIMFAGSHQKDNSPFSSSIVGEEDKKDKGDDEVMTAESLVTNGKRKRVCSNKLKMAQADRCEKQRQGCSFKRSKPKKLKESISRWSEDRYKRAEQCLLEIMRSEKAVFGNPIVRPTLRSVARKHIGDTGLLDHLLKHMDGKVAPGGAERFRRCYNPNGVMEYWLESADLVNIRLEAGVQDPYWIPPSTWKPGSGPSEDLVLSEELKLLKAEMEKTKRDVQELISKRQEEDRLNMKPNASSPNRKLKLDHSTFSRLSCQEIMYEELLIWKAKTEQQLIEISNSLSSMQGVYQELEKWKANIENQLREISNSLSSMKKNRLAPWWETSDLISFQHEDLTPWLESADLNIPGEVPSWLASDEAIKVEREVLQSPCLVKIECEVEQNASSIPLPAEKLGKDPSQDPVCARELGLLKEDLAKIKREVQEMVTKKEMEDEANFTPNSSVITHSRLDLHSSLLILQEMHEELMKWKDNIEQQLLDISNSFASLQAEAKCSGL